MGDRNDQPNPATPPTVCLLAGYTPARFPDQSLALPRSGLPPAAKLPVPKTPSPSSLRFGLSPRGETNSYEATSRTPTLTSQSPRTQMSLQRARRHLPASAECRRARSAPFKFIHESLDFFTSTSFSMATSFVLFVHRPT